MNRKNWKLDRKNWKLDLVIMIIKLEKCGFSKAVEILKERLGGKL